MRIALCLYGQPRDFGQNWNFIHKNIISGNEVDVFLHTWYNPEDLSINKMTPGHENRRLESNLTQILPEITSAKDHIIEPQINFNDKLVTTSEKNIEECWSYSKSYDREKFVRDRVKSSYSMWYSINQSVMLKEKYAQHHKFEYDIVVISRFDVSPKTSIDFSTINLTKLTSGYKSLPREQVNDWFMIGNNKTSNIVCSTFFNIDYHRDKMIQNDEIWTNEIFLREQLRTFGIEVDYREDLQITF